MASLKMRCLVSLVYQLFGLSKIKEHQNGPVSPVPFSTRTYRASEEGGGISACLFLLLQAAMSHPGHTLSAEPCLCLSTFWAAGLAFAICVLLFPS